MSRREFPAKVKVAAYNRSNGLCEKCTAPLLPGRFDYDHRIPDALGGTPTIDNCAVVCKSCHASKTAKDVTKIAKAKRVERKHIGAHRPKHKMPYRRFDGTPVWR